MVPTSHLSTISFYFISRSTDVWVSTSLASSILLAISALFFHRKPSAGTHGVIVFALVPRSRAPCARQRALPVRKVYRNPCSKSLGKVSESRFFPQRETGNARWRAQGALERKNWYILVTHAGTLE